MRHFFLNLIALVAVALFVFGAAKTAFLFCGICLAFLSVANTGKQANAKDWGVLIVLVCIALLTLTVIHFCG